MNSMIKLYHWYVIYFIADDLNSFLLSLIKVRDFNRVILNVIVLKGYKFFNYFVVVVVENFKFEKKRWVSFNEIGKTVASFLMYWPFKISYSVLMLLSLSMKTIVKNKFHIRYSICKSFNRWLFITGLHFCLISRIFFFFSVI